VIEGGSLGAKQKTVKGLTVKRSRWLDKRGARVYDSGSCLFLWEIQL